MSSTNWRVVKLGGSLLDRADLPARLRCWLADQPAINTLVVCGGGAVVDVLRGWDETHQLSAATNHRLAIRLMSVNATMLTDLLPEADLFDDLQQCGRASDSGLREPRLVIYDPWPSLTDDLWLSRSNVLPHSWDVTSDSIAARVAEHLGAEELVLLKSAAFETLARSDWRQRAAADGYVDAYFPTASERVQSVRCICLTDPRYDDTD